MRTTALIVAGLALVLLSAADASEVWAAHSTAPLELRPAVLASLSQIAALSAAQVEQLAGPMDLRLGELARHQPNGIRAVISRRADEGVIATGEVLVPASAEQAQLRVGASGGKPP